MSDKHYCTTEVMNEIVAGDGLSTGEAAAILPGHRNSSRAHVTFMYRLIVDGTRVGNRVVKLEAARLGGRFVTTRGAVRRYLEALNGS